MERRSVFLLALVFVSSYAYGQQVKPLQFREEIHDFGSVNENEGSVVHQFDFTNLGTRPVKILSVKASCGCTTPDWSRDPVMPGKTGFIQASFNPKGRPGYFSKSLTVTTDFDASPIVLQIKGQVDNEKKTSNLSDFPAKKGNWHLKVSSLNMGKVYLKDTYESKDFAFVNSSSKPVTFQKYVGPSYIKADVLPKTVAPGGTGRIVIGYNGKMKNQYGFQSDNIQIQTDDDTEPLKSFSVYATLEEYFPPLTQKDLDDAPQIKITETSFDMGRIKQNGHGSYQVSVLNIGKNNLVLRAIQPNCSCITAKANKETIKPGENAALEIRFNPKDREGTQQKAIMIYSNDPQNPVQRITFTAYVED